MKFMPGALGFAALIKNDVSAAGSQAIAGFGSAILTNINAGTISVGDLILLFSFLDWTQDGVGAGGWQFLTQKSAGTATIQWGNALASAQWKGFTVAASQLWNLSGTTIARCTVAGTLTLSTEIISTSANGGTGGANQRLYVIRGS